ncbi:MAG: ribonuclease III [Lachnospiraceae bacterium]|nr:ribonuclease III [Lachnospiraceae bacterium]
MELFDIIKEKFNCKEVDPLSYSPLTLAYIGDSIYEVVIRTYVIGNGNRPPHKLHKESSQLVKAATQRQMIMGMLEELTSEEASVYRRGRNAQSGTIAKNATVSDYRKASGFEALIGWLYITGQTERMLELIYRGCEIVWQASEQK